MVEGDGWMEGEGKNGGALADNYALRLNNSISSFIFRLIFLQLFFFVIFYLSLNLHEFYKLNQLFQIFYLFCI